MSEKPAKAQKTPHRPPVKQRRYHYSIYVIELAPEVWNIAHATWKSISALPWGRRVMGFGKLDAAFTS